MADTMPDLSFLSELEAEATEMARTTRGRPAEPNPMEVQYLKSYNGPRERKNYRDSKGQTRTTWYGPALQLKVKSEIAHYVERLLRRAADATPDGGVTVQFFLSADSDTRITVDELPETKPRKDPKTGEPIEVEKIKRGRNVWVAFQAKERIEKPRRHKILDLEEEEDNGDDETYGSDERLSA